ncbi:MAG: acetyl-CoA C-acetyltransferase [Chloroflexota bacterium]|nr:acetyl-CoA C-acetyltransferase [Chloroflexota bacterium]
MENVVIVDYLRTPFSRSRPSQPERDVYDKVFSADLAGMLVKKLVERTKINAADINDVVTGCTMQAGEQMLLGGRIINMLADLPINVPAQGIDRVCCSGMSAIHRCAMEIELGYSDVCVACGMEHMTHLGMDFQYNPHAGATPTLMQPEYAQKYDLMVTMNMGLTAEKLFDEAKQEFGMTREDLDKWGVRSHNFTEKALNEGYFADELVPVEATMPDGTKKIIDSDQSLRKGANMEETASLNPAFKPDGAITAGNSSPLNAGATAMMLMSKKKAEQYGLKPMARIVSMGWAGVEPSVMGKGPVPASEVALEHAGLKVSDIDFWEINEAFTIVALYAIKKLGIDPEKVNVKGGATAIGHPLAASGIRLTGTLARILNLNNARYGCATLCGGGGQGTTTIIERI